MKFTPTPFKDLIVLEPKVFGDSRGYFFESYNQKTYADLGLNYQFVQDNESFSSYGTLRGLHFQRGEAAQAKLVRVLEGKVLDVVVDLRLHEPTFGKVFSIELSSENKKMMIIPRGFAHGFVVLSPTALFSYKCDNFYNPSAESGLLYNDPDLGINWLVPEKDLILSEKDKKNPLFKDIKSHL
ncbi:MAG: dTDP-4-dehydrorhamnose 3,5-epimerase [Bacteriovoracaceae bacterium]|nr:dTDP-4-dehydrorhamnose 3,5-epimerase [Bacteriovoracaceae bacterium]